MNESFQACRINRHRLVANQKLRSALVDRDLKNREKAQRGLLHRLLNFWTRAAVV